MSSYSPQHVPPFDAIRYQDKQDNEYWSACELYKILGYTGWRNFNNIVIKRAIKAREENGQAVLGCFVRSYKAITGGKGARQQVEDVHLSRYAAYLVVMSGNPNMPVVAMGQEYFAGQTRRQELADELAQLPEDQLRLVRRSQMSVLNTQLPSLFSLSYKSCSAIEEFAVGYSSSLSSLGSCAYKVVWPHSVQANACKGV